MWLDSKCGIIRCSYFFTEALTRSMIIFHNIVVMLATSSSGERSFSRVKTYLQSTMGQSLTLLKHKELRTCISCYEFAQANDRRVQGYNDFLLPVDRMINSIWLIFNQKGSQSTALFQGPQIIPFCFLWRNL